MACRIMPERLKLLVAALETSVNCILTGCQVIQGDKLCDTVSKALKAPLEKYSLKPLKADKGPQPIKLNTREQYKNDPL